MTTKLTATDFRNPLLRVLGKLTKYTAGQPIKSSDTYNDVMALMGIKDINAHGTNAASGGTPQVAKWIQWANTTCRKADLTENKGRGQWSLTELGVIEALRLAEITGDPSWPGLVPTPKPSPAAHMLASVAMHPVVAKAAPMSMAPVVLADPSGYHADAYVRKLAIDQTGCFSKFSPHGAAVCADCPLRGECRNRQMSTYSLLAARLFSLDHAPVASPAPKVVSTKAPTSSTTRFDEIDFSKEEIIKNKTEALCASCGKTIAKNERCRWVEELPDDDDDGDGGLFHLACSGGA